MPKKRSSRLSPRLSSRLHRLANTTDKKYPMPDRKIPDREAIHQKALRYMVPKAYKILLSHGVETKKLTKKEAETAFEFLKYMDEKDPKGAYHDSFDGSRHDYTWSSEDVPFLKKISVDNPKCTVT